MKKITAFIVIIATIVALVGCGTAQKKEEAGTGGEFSVGFLDQAGEEGPVVRMREIIRDVVEAAGGKLICDTSGEDSTDAQINACEKLISAGVKGIIITPIADSVLPTIISMCEENEVYLAITFRNIEDQDVKALVEASPYYAGNCFEDEEAAGYNVMTQAFEQNSDIKQVALVSLQIGDNTSDARVAGIERACKENGAEIVAEVRNIGQASDATEAVESFIASFPELDCIAVASCKVPSAITAIPNAIKSTGKTADEICIASCDGGSDLEELFKDGYAVAVGGGHLEIDRGATAVLVVNAILGNPLGEPAHISIPYMYFNDSEDVVNYTKYVEGDIPIWTEEEIKENLLISDSNSLTEKDVIAYIQAYSVDDLVSRHSSLLD